jgi:hypothetical protein
MPQKRSYCTHEFKGKRDCTVTGSYYLCNVDGTVVSGGLAKRRCFTHRLKGQVHGSHRQAEFRRDRLLQQSGMPVPKKRNLQKPLPGSIQEKRQEGKKDTLRCTFVYDNGQRCEVTGNYYKVILGTDTACSTAFCKYCAPVQPPSDPSY